VSGGSVNDLAHAECIEHRRHKAQLVSALTPVVMSHGRAPLTRSILPAPENSSTSAGYCGMSDTCNECYVLYPVCLLYILLPIKTGGTGTEYTVADMKGGRSFCSCRMTGYFRLLLMHH
jgi:hypothetical protein